MRPLMIDYLCALIEPAMFHADAAARQTAFDRIREQAEVFLGEPSGAGLDVPTWLISMEDTVRSFDEQNEASLTQLMEKQMLPAVGLSIEEIQSIVGTWREESQDAND